MPEPETPSRKRRWAWYLGSALVLLAAGLALLPWGIRWGAEYWLRNQGQEARIEDISFNLFTGRLELAAVTAGRGADAQLSLQSVVLRMDWWPLWQRRIYLEDVSLSGLVLDVERGADGAVRVGGLPVGGATPEQEPAPDDPGEEPWGIAVANLELENIEIHYRDPHLATQVVLRRLRVDPLASWEPDVPTPFVVVLELEGGTVELDGTAQPFRAHPVVEAQLTVSELPLGWLTPALAGTGLEEFAVAVSASAALNAAAVDSGAEFRYDGSLTLTGVQVDGVDLQSGAEQLAWAGSVATRLDATQTGVEINGDLQLDRGTLTTGEIQATAESVSLAADLDGTVAPTVALDGTLSLGVSAAAAAGYALSQLAMQWTGPVAADPAAGTVHTQGELRVQDAAAKGSDLGLSAHLAELVWKGAAGLEEGQDGPLQPALSGDLQVLDLGVRSLRAERGVLELEGMELSTLDVSGTADISLAGARLAGLRVLEYAGAEPDGATHGLSLREAEISDVRVAESRRIAVAAVHLRGLAAEVIRGADGSIAGLDLLPSSADAAAPSPTPEPSPEDSGPILQLGRLTVDPDTRVVFRDRSVQPRVDLTLDVAKLAVTGIDTARPETVTELALAATLGGYAEMRLDGQGTLLAPLASGQATASVAGLSLPPLTGYMERYLGYRLNTGQLDLDSKATVDAGQLDAQNKLVLHRLDLDLLRPGEQDELTQQLGLPLNTALSLLRDGDGDIRLSIPVQGDLKKPDIDIGDVIGKAVKKGAVLGIKTAAVAFFAPVGAVMAAGKAISLATALRFEPVRFEAGAAALDGAARNYLEELAGLLQKRPGVRITLCGLATPGDLEVLQARAREAAQPSAGSQVATTEPQAEEPTPDSQSPAAEPPPPIPDSELLGLARSRAVAVRDFLVDQGRIDPKRLLECTPRMERREGATPRVEVAL